MPSDKPLLPHHHRSTAASLAARVALLLIPIGGALLLWLSTDALFGVRADGASAPALAGLIALAAVGFVVLLAGFALSVILNPHPGDHWLLIGASLAAVGVGGASLLSVVAALAVAVALAAWRQAMLLEARGRIRFSFSRTMRASFGLTLSLLAVAVAVQSVTPSRLLVEPDVAAGRLLDGAGRAAAQLLPVLVEGLEPRRQLDDYLEQVAAALQSGQSPLVPFPGLKIEGAPTAQALRQQLSENLGLSLTGRETVGDLIQQMVRARLAPAFTRAAGLFAPLFVLSLFLLVQAVNPLLEWLAIGLALAVYQVVRAGGWVRVVREKVDVERIAVG